MKRKKVLLTAFNHLDVGGIQKMIMTLVEGLQDKIQFDIIVFSSKEGYYENDFKKIGKVFHCPNYEGENQIKSKIDYYIRYYRVKNVVTKVIRENGPYDVFHTNAFFESAPCLDAAYHMGIPIRIAHSHNTGTQDRRVFPVRLINKLYRIVYRSIILKYATDCIGCSDAAREYLFGKNNGYVIYNCVGDGFFVSSKKNCDELRLLNVGNFVEQKNQVFLIDVFNEFIKLCPRSHLTMVGRITPYYDKVMSKIRQYNLEKQISVLPYDSDISAVMNESDYFLLPSLFEGLPLVLLEAQKSGLHCFTSASVTRECNCGLVEYLELNDAKKWAEIIYKHYTEYGIQKREVNITKFEKNTYINEFLNVYRK